MRIVVCVKSVPDTASHIRVNPSSSAIDLDGLTFVMNPYDEFAVEEALRIKEKHGQVEITAISVGGNRAKDVLRIALSMGIDRAVHLTDSSFEGLNSQGVAQVLARAMQKLGFDLILCGKQAVDMDSAQVGPALAEILGLPQVGVVTKLEFDSHWQRLRAWRQIEGATEIVESGIPCVITTQKGLNEPRYPSLRGILAAKKKEIPEWGPSQVEPEGKLGPLTSRVQIVGLQNPPPRIAGRILEGEVGEKVRELVRLLREEAKAI